MFFSSLSVRAMVFDRVGSPLKRRELPDPLPGPGQLRVRVLACAVCRTDLHVVDGELPNPKLPLVPGHEIVGQIDRLGPGVDSFRQGDRVGIPWLGWTCGECEFCRSDRENLCTRARFTGYTIDGGYAEMAVADARFCFRIPENYGDIEAAPLLCAGLIGFRCLRKAGGASRIGIYGFGAAAHIIAQVARHEKGTIYAFTRPGDTAAQRFAIEMGADWAGGSDQAPPEKLDAAIIFAPVGNLVPAALHSLRRGGIVVCGGIHMSDIPSFSYADLWHERVILSVANLTRRDAIDFFEMAARVPIRTQTKVYPLAEANSALNDLRSGKLTGAAVLVP